jgi:hypothetical protein
MTRIGSLSARLRELEASQGYVTLDDGSKHRFKNSGLKLYGELVRHGRNTGREVVLSDFSEDEQRDLLAYSNWTPDQAMHGQIAIITAKIAREIVTTGDGGSRCNSIS